MNYDFLLYTWSTVREFPPLLHVRRVLTIYTVRFLPSPAHLLPSSSPPPFTITIRTRDCVFALFLYALRSFGLEVARPSPPVVFPGFALARILAVRAGSVLLRLRAAVDWALHIVLMAAVLPGEGRASKVDGVDARAMATGTDGPLVDT